MRFLRVLGRLGRLGFARFALLGADDIGEPGPLAAFDGRGAVVAAVQVQGLDVGKQATAGQGSLESNPEFTASVPAACARAVYRMSRLGQFGAKRGALANFSSQ